MQNLVPLILIGFLIYFIFLRKGGRGGIGCCGGHGSDGGHVSDKGEKVNTMEATQPHNDKVIDLQEGKDYVFLPVKNEASPFEKK